MICAIQGRQGGGKTRIQTILGLYLHHVTKLPLYSNYTLFGVKYTPVNTLSQIWQITNGILLLDELWISADARKSSQNVDFTDLIAQLRKKRLIVFFTTQQIRKIDVRVRDATDILIHCENGNQATFVDYQYETILRKYTMENLTYFNKFYNTYEPMKPMQMQQKKAD